MMREFQKRAVGRLRLWMVLDANGTIRYLCRVRFLCPEVQLQRSRTSPPSGVAGSHYRDASSKNPFDLTSHALHFS